MNENKLIIAAIVSGTNNGDGTPNSKIPWAYLLFCSSSTTLLVTLKPQVDKPMDFRKNSAVPSEKLERFLIIHIL